MNSPEPGSPAPQRPMSALMRPPRSNSRMSVGSNKQGGSRASDEDGKTAVKVAVRVRPPLRPEDPGFELIPQRFQRPIAQVTTPTNLAIDTPQGRKLFVFDRVFSEQVDQEGVWDYLHDSVNSFVQGYNVSILAYGQSGAGKSYTMGTSEPSEQDDAKSNGIIPRAAQLLFETLNGGQPSHNRSASSASGPISGLRTPTRYSMTSPGQFGRALADKNWQLKATYVEIYNEHLRDLLLPDQTPVNDRGTVTIREDTKGRIILTGLHQVSINSIDDLMGALSFGSAIRQTDATAINAKSSRSHAVFSLNLVQRKDGPATPATPAREKRFSVPVEALTGSDAAAVTFDSKLHFVDLAGSERLKNTGASGERAKEGISINAGLASLGKVISQLSSRQAGAHVSYRDSKLTRLLQDSLGGNAITYMIACVTPAEFHMSETLNTVQYAQRARAIQSKPRIQQTMDESDKQAVIDRLKAEIAFLRQQIRNSESSGGERRNNAPQERGERSNEREIELQNHLLDSQESYTALSQRHAKLITELTKATDFNGDPEELTNIISDSAMERLKRSHSFAESVEQVVLEYEKTIQSLESSLSNTRSSLANTESTLLERETKCAYVETVNSQLQSRIQKMIDREGNTENYLHELEAKLDGHSTGEEKNVAIIAELRKEIARARENEASCEDYISSLEERLAEADQDMELMQREVDRLEHVIDRQRSLGKLDNLLYELDHIQQNGTKHGNERDNVSTPTGRQSRARKPRNHSLDVLMEAAETAIPESDDDLVDAHHLAEAPPEEVEPDFAESDKSGLEALEKISTPREVLSPVLPVEASEKEESRPGTSHSRVPGDGLENVTQELLQLRIQHESTVSDFDLLSAKYEEALRNLAEMRDTVDEARHPVDTPVTASPPVPFLEDPRVHGLKGGDQSRSSRSLSAELSSVEDSPMSPVTIDIPQKPGSVQPEPTEKEQEDAAAARELESLRSLLMEHQQGMGAVAQQYAQLQAEHEDTLGMVENLRTELEKSKNAPPASPSPTQKVIRRMTSQNLISVDRAHRSLTTLRNIAAEGFENQPDTMENFERHLNNAMHELHSRLERIQTLESDNQGIKKEMEMKSTIISGLTRERSSLQGASPVDRAVVSQLRDQIVAYESQMNDMQESHDAMEAELKSELLGLNDILGEYKTTVEEKEAELKAQTEATESAQIEKEQLEEQYNSTAATLQSTQEKLQATMADLEVTSAERAEWQEKHNTVLADMETASTERAEWQSKHQAAAESLQSSEIQLQSTLAELNATLASLDTLRNERKDADGASSDEIAAASADLESERAKHTELVNGLNLEIETQKGTIATHLASMAVLEKQCAEATANLSENSSAKNADVQEIESYKARVAELTEEIEAHRSTVEMQKTELSSLQTTHEEALKELDTKLNASAESQVEARIAEESVRHEEAVNELRTEITSSKTELTRLMDVISGLLKAPVTVSTVQDQLQDILAQKQNFADKYGELIDTNEVLLKQLDTKSTSHDVLEKQVGEFNERAKQHEVQINELAHLVATHEEALKAKEELVGQKEEIIKDISAEKEKSVRLVEELEEQITSTFDQHHNRLSVIQQERVQALDEAKIKLAQCEKDIEAYRTRIDHLEGNVRAASPDGNSADRTSSMTSNLRKSASAASLPSPPPAIPLPPLPNIAAATNGNSISPPSSRHQSKDLAHTNAQVVEDQEARIRTIEKHLHAEKQLTATLEEALGDLEAQSNKVKADMETWKKKAWQLEEELNQLKSERKSTRLSVQQMEEERSMRREAEAARAQLEEKMNTIHKKKKKSTLNCF